MERSFVNRRGRSIGNLRQRGRFILSGCDGAIFAGKSQIYCPAASDGFGQWAVTGMFSRRKKAVRAYPRLGPLYHNGTALYQNDAVMRDILYALNGRRTNRARIGDKAQIFVCSLQYIGEC